MHPNFERPFTLDRIVRIVIGAVILIGLFLLIGKLSGVLIPFLVAWLIAYLMYPLVRFLEKKVRIKSRIVSILISLVLSIGTISAIGYMLFVPITNEISHLSKLIIKYAQGGYDSQFFPDNWEEWLLKIVNMPELQSILSGQDWGQIAEKILPSFWTVFSGGVNVILSIFIGFIILLYIIFILLDYEAISSGWIDLLPQKYRSFIRQLADDLEDGMNRYFRGQATIAFTVGILFSVGFSIINLPLGIVLGLFIGLLNMVPYLQIIGFIPLTLMALLKSMESDQSFGMIMLGVLIVFAIVQGFQDSFLVPRIMGKRMGLNPAIILLSLSIWGALLGLIGMIIALPVTTLIIAYYKRFVLDEKQVETPPQQEAPKIDD